MRAHNVKFAGHGRARIGIKGIVVGKGHRDRRAALFVDLDRNDDVKFLSLLAARAGDIGIVGFNAEGRGIVTRIIGHSVLAEIAVELRRDQTDEHLDTQGKFRVVGRAEPHICGCDAV